MPQVRQAAFVLLAIHRDTNLPASLRQVTAAMVESPWISKRRMHLIKVLYRIYMDKLVPTLFLIHNLEHYLPVADDNELDPSWICYYIS